MKLLPISATLAIAITLIATTVGSIATTQTNFTSSARSTVAPKLIAQGTPTPLAAQLQGKPVVVDIYASWCPGCRNIAPTLSQLKQKYSAKANFVVFDVTNNNKTQASMKMAEKLGLSSFFSANKSQTATVAIIDPATGKVIKQFRNNADLAEYTGVIDRSIAQMGKGGVMKKS
ncbi:thioredoxin domain-containing protein [Chamaesiphon sp. OTE_8_metabat_110]|uniref:thioredoxin domain-containing protein n=1 Tax=Chamaesiphon sp. OTE_8_metabat_110 TaxID=2964696 RepID=UPI00286C7326|nr:thioredoxin domain-containing protein [Chamaesiphon sp. OTE_8_metabat_110]